MRLDVKEKRTFHFFPILLAICSMIFAVSCRNAPGVPEEFEGKYHWTNGYGRVDVVLAKDRSFQYKWGGCVGEYLNEYGKYSFRNGKIVIAFVGTDLQFKDFKKPTYREYYLAKWGQRHLLVPMCSMELYCCAVAAQKDLKYHGDEDMNAFLVKVSEEKAPLDYNATIPPEYYNYYLKLVNLMPDENKVLAGKEPIPYLWHDYYLWLNRNSGEQKYRDLNISERKIPYVSKPLKNPTIKKQ